MKILDSVKEDDLTYFGYRAEPYFAAYLTTAGMQNKKRSIELFGIKTVVRWLHLNYYLYQFREDLIKIENEVKSKLEKEGNRYVDGLIEKCIKAGKKLRKISIKLGEEANTLTDKKKLAKILSEYRQAILDYTIFYQLTFFEGAIMRIARSVVESNIKPGQEFEELFGLISVADRLTEAEYEQDDFLRVIMTEDKDRVNMAEAHAKRYGWLSVRYFMGDPWTKENVLKRLKGTDRRKAKKELEDRLRHRVEREDKINKAIRSFSKNDKQVIKLIRKIVYLRTQRGDFYHESASHVRPLLSRVAEELGITYLRLVNLSPTEAVDALLGKFDYKKHVEARANNFLIYHDINNGNEVLEGKEVDDYLETHSFLKMNTENVSEFVGKIGYKGKIKGVAKILKTNEDMSKVKKGEVVITAMTTANLLPALEKASAFVTDEGGITCHAAIIAREMRKPCIIGTKIATMVLKDGDLIEVDANKGIVKIIK
ncbi:MAG: PEP-utilizing enzyme [Patescibacteria group bacterium]|jgi:phosphohistidine swiveling domain-containing protein